MSRFKLIIFIFFSLFLQTSFGQDSTAENESYEEYLFQGEGTEKNPYEINDLKDLCGFRDNVNNGYSYYEKWFVQNNDLDLSSIENFEPIGLFGSGKFFFGIYDGKGHTIKNLNINYTDDCVGLFGQLGGVVLNLGIESGIVHGACIGSIASHSAGSPMIINCFNKANLKGNFRAGGIADNFSGGVIINCYNEGTVSGHEPAGICSYNATVIKNCYDTTKLKFVGEYFNGVGLSTCLKVDSIPEKLLNKNLYKVATYTNYQHNNLNYWSKSGFKHDRHNYKIFFFLRDLVTVFLLILFLSLIYYVYSAKCKQNYFKNLHRSNKNLIIIVLPFIFCYIMLLSHAINEDNMLWKSFFGNTDTIAFTDLELYPMQFTDFSEGFYKNNSGAYPVIARLILWIFGYTIPTKTLLGGINSIRFSTYFLLLIIVYEGLSLLALSKLWQRLLKNKLAFIFLISSLVIYLMERGNLVFFVLILLSFFILEYNSEIPHKRIFAYIALGLATSIKIYPCLYGILILKENNKKNTLQAIIIGLIFVFVPFLFVGGFQSIKDYIFNLSNAQGTTGANWNGYMLNWKEVITATCNIFDFTPSKKIFMFSYILIILGLFFLCILEKFKWKAFLEITLLMIFIPGFSVYYMACFYVIPLILWLTENNTKKRDYFFIVPLIIILVPLQFLCGTYGASRLTIRFIAQQCELFICLLLVFEKTVYFLKKLLKINKTIEET